MHQQNIEHDFLEALVVNAAHAGYRRAGFDLDQGENILQVTATQFNALQSDPRLVVSVVAKENFPVYEMPITESGLLGGVVGSSELHTDVIANEEVSAGAVNAEAVDIEKPKRDKK